MSSVQSLKHRFFITALFLTGSVGSVWAQTPLDANRGAPKVGASAASVEQKAAMVDKVLNKSPVPARVAASKDEQARRHLTHAQELFGHAKGLASTGLYRQADSLLNDAIAELSRAQQLVPDPGALQAEGRARYTQLEDGFLALKRTAVVAMSAVGGGSAAAEEASRAMAQANEMASQAAQLARSDKYPEANAKMDQALLVMMKSTASRLSGQTLVYDHKFATRKEEFDFEVGRFDNYERLVPLALLEYKPSPEARALIQRYVEQAQQLKAAGMNHASNDLNSAIKSVSDGTDTLRRALQAAGLVVPQTMENAQ